MSVRAATAGSVQQVRAMADHAVATALDAAREPSLDGIRSGWRSVERTLGPLQDDVRTLAAGGIPGADAGHAAMLSHAQARLARVGELADDLEVVMPRFEHLLGAREQAATRIEWIARELRSASNVIDGVGSTPHRLFRVIDRLDAIAAQARGATGIDDIQAARTGARHQAEALTAELDAARSELTRLGQAGIDALTPHDTLPFRAVGINAAR